MRSLPAKMKILLTMVKKLLNNRNELFHDGVSNHIEASLLLKSVNWFLYDRQLRYDRVNLRFCFDLSHPGVPLHTEISPLICTADQIT